MTLTQRLRYLFSPPKGLTPLRLDAKQCEFAFNDMDGKAYFRIPVDQTFPLERHAKRAEITQWMSAGLTNSELISLLDRADEAMQNLIQGKKGSLAIVGAVHNEIRTRESLVVHHELIYQYIAIHYIREDEPVYSYSDEWQNRKIESFKAMVAGGRSLDFFQLPELKRIREITEMSSEQFLQYWSESLTAQTALNLKLKYLKQQLKSGSETKTSIKV